MARLALGSGPQSKPDRGERALLLRAHVGGIRMRASADCPLTRLNRSVHLGGGFGGKTFLQRGSSSATSLASAAKAAAPSSGASASVFLHPGGTSSTSSTLSCVSGLNGDSCNSSLRFVSLRPRDSSITASEDRAWHEGCRPAWHAHCPDEREVRMSSGRDRRAARGHTTPHCATYIRAGGTRGRGVACGLEDICAERRRRGAHAQCVLCVLGEARQNAQPRSEHLQREASRSAGPSCQARTERILSGGVALVVVVGPAFRAAGESASVSGPVSAGFSNQSEAERSPVGGSSRRDPACGRSGEERRALKRTESGTIPGGSLRTTRAGPDADAGAS